MPLYFINISVEVCLSCLLFVAKCTEVQKVVSFASSFPLPKLIPKDPYAQLFHYTSGRWLRNDKQQRDARKVEFNYDALCRRILQVCTDASTITFLEKKEGGFSKVLLFATDTGQKIVARFPTRVSGPRRLTTNSEVATIQYRALIRIPCHC